MKNFFIFFFVLFAFNLFAQMRFGKIDFEGNYLLSKSELKNVIHAKKGEIFDNKIINGDMKRIADAYKKKGYLNVKVYYPIVIAKSPEDIQLTYKIKENPALLIKSVKITGNKYVATDKLKSIIGENFYLSGLSDRLKMLLEYLNEQGFFFASVKVKNIEKKNNFLFVTIKVKEGDFCEFNKFVFKGNKVSSNKSLLRISGLNRVKKITPTVIRNAEDNIKRKSYIKDCSIIPINKNEILISVSEASMNYFNGIVGYNNKEKKGKQFNGFLNFVFLNIAGEDRSVEFKWKNVPSKIKTVYLSYHHPNISKYPIGADLSFYRTEKDFVKTEMETEFYINNYQYKYGVSASYEYFYANYSNGNFIKSKNIKPGLWFQINTSDSFYNPTKGYGLDFHYYLIFSTIKKTKKSAFKMGYKKFIPIKNNLIFYSGFFANLMQNKDIKNSDYFTLGGVNNLRGFLEDNFLGYQLFWSNLEMRFLLGGYSSFFFFTDYGYVKNLEYTKGKLFGFGAGLRLGTKLGILEFDYALGYQNGKLRSPLNGIVHFGLSSGI